MSLSGQVADDPDRAVAVDIHREIGIGGDARQIEPRVVGQAGREMQIGTRIGLDIAERRDALVDALRVGEFAGIGDALVVVDREPASAERRRARRNGRRTRRRRAGRRGPASAAAGTERPGEPGGEPQRERHGDEILRPQQIHRAEEYQSAKAGAREVGEIDAPERAVALEENAAEKHGAGEERREIGEENLQQLPFLRGIGDQEDRVEAELLDEKVGADGKRAEQPERDARRDAPVALRTSPWPRTSRRWSGRSRASRG